MTTKISDKLKKITGQTDFPFVSAGIVASENANGHVLNEDALVALVEAADAGEAAQATIADQALQAQQAVAAQQTAEAALATANQTIAANTTRIQELEARVAELEGEAGVTNTNKEKDGAEGKVAFHESAKNPMNQIADSLLGAPVTKP